MALWYNDLSDQLSPGQGSRPPRYCGRLWSGPRWSRGSDCAPAVCPQDSFTNKSTLRINHMAVSINGGIPKSSILMGLSNINQLFLGTSIYGNPHMNWAPTWLESVFFFCLGSMVSGYTHHIPSPYGTRRAAWGHARRCATQSGSAPGYGEATPRGVR